MQVNCLLDFLHDIRTAPGTRLQNIKTPSLECLCLLKQVKFKGGTFPDLQEGALVLQSPWNRTCSVKCPTVDVQKSIASLSLRPIILPNQCIVFSHSTQIGRPPANTPNLRQITVEPADLRLSNE